MKLRKLEIGQNGLQYLLRFVPTSLTLTHSRLGNNYYNQFDHHYKILNIKNKTLTLHYGILIIILAVYDDDIKTNIKTRHRIELCVL